ncbi:MAG: HAMP domain-containing protein, partial [Chloroflexales bacterium]|nr:HAMP domain-containing protein [Chloroflexales bacterium]
MRYRLLLSVGLSLVLVLLTGAVSLVYQGLVRSMLLPGLERSFQVRDLGLQLEGSFLRARQHEVALLSGLSRLDAAEGERLVRAHAAALAEARGRLDALERVAESEPVRGQIARLGPLLDRYEATFRGIVDVAGMPPLDDDLGRAIATFQGLSDEISGVVGGISATTAVELSESRARLATLEALDTAAMGIFAVTALLLVVVMIARLNSHVFGPLEELTEVAGRLARGDLGAAAPVHRPDEL